MVSQPQVLPPERLIHLGLGLASPLWPAFYAAAAAGLAVWSFGAMVRATGASIPDAAGNGTVVPQAPALIPSPVKAATRPQPARKRPSRARTAAAPAKGPVGV